MLRFLLLFCVVCSFVSAEEEFQPFTASVKGQQVRVRSQPDLDGQIIKELSEGEHVLVTGEAHDYFAIAPIKGSKLYVYKTYVVDGAIKGTHVNVRLAPNLEAPIVAQLNTGDEVAGTLCSEDDNWMEISPPDGVCFFIAKDYLKHVGGENYIANREKRAKEVGHLLHSAKATCEGELVKSFEEIDFTKVASGFERVIAEYADFPEEADRAQEILDKSRDRYLAKKIAFLEAKARDGRIAFEQRSQRLNAELEAYSERLESFQNELDPTLEAVAAADDEASAIFEEEFEDGRAFHQVAVGPVTTDGGSKSSWEPVEEALFHLWAMDRETEVTMEDFYREQEWESTVIEGVVESYNRPVMNRPGDFLLRDHDQPVAFLYSTQVDLADRVGEPVKIRVLERPNNHFAFPAYFVLSVE